MNSFFGMCPILASQSMQYLWKIFLCNIFKMLEIVQGFFSYCVINLYKIQYACSIKIYQVDIFVWFRDIESHSNARRTYFLLVSFKLLFLYHLLDFTLSFFVRLLVRFLFVFCSFFVRLLVRLLAKEM